MHTTTNPTIGTVTRTAKGARIEFPFGGRFAVANVGASFGFVVLYSTGGWNPETNASDRPALSKHKTLESALKKAREVVEVNGGTFEVVEVAAL